MRLRGACRITGNDRSLPGSYRLKWIAWQRHTKQPEVLREIFEALGNDPFVIAECLARPVLTERFIADLSAQDERRPFESAPTKTLRVIL